MDITATTPRRARTISNIVVQVPAPYTAGHVVTEAEASILNQTLGENISNNLRDKLSPVTESGTAGQPGYVAARAAPSVEEAQKLVDDYITSYTPGVRGAGGGTPRIVDPVEREMRALATAKVLEVLKSKNILRKNVEATSFENLVDKALEKRSDEYRKTAKQIVAARTKVGAGEGDDDLGEITLKAPTPEAPASQPAA